MPSTMIRRPGKPELVPFRSGMVGTGFDDDREYLLDSPNGRLERPRNQPGSRQRHTIVRPPAGNASGAVGRGLSNQRVGKRQYRREPGQRGVVGRRDQWRELLQAGAV